MTIHLDDDVEVAQASQSSPVGELSSPRPDVGIAEVMTAKSNAARSQPVLAVQTLAAFVALALISLTAFIAVGRVAVDDERRLLEKRSTEVSALLTAALSEVRSALTLLSSLTSPSDAPAFTTAAASLVSGPVAAVGRADSDGGLGFVEGAGAGEVATGSVLTKDRAAVLLRALRSTDVVTGVLHTDSGARIIFALAGQQPSTVVFREAAISPKTVATTVRGEAFGDLDVTLYASDKASEQSQILTTRLEPILNGYSTPLTIGADHWLLVTAPRGALDGLVSPRFRWIVLGFGLTVAVALSSLVETLARRRRFALRLVDRRTAQLERALDERSRLEEGQRAAREEAETANHAKSDFLSRMSHELRTPLNGVLGFAQLLELEPLTDQQRDSVKQITKGGWHLLGLINEVLDITRIETGSVALSPEPVLASELVTETFDLVRPLAMQRGMHLIGTSMPGCDAFVYADRQRVKQILINLLSNAIKYNRAGGSVAVRCTCGETSLQIGVTDTGPGISAEHFGMLFVPFERLGAEHGDIEGTGIGLALSRRLAEAMGGALTCETAVGKGSTFLLELPLVEGPVERFVRLGPTIDPGKASVSPTAKRRLLYIEDNLSNLRLVERLLESRPDVELIAAMQGRLGLELTRQHLPAAVLLDLHLPDVDGSEVLRYLREDPTTSSIPVIIVSADATPGQVRRLLAAGAYAYLTKPLDVRELLGLLDEILERPQ
jgi:signal transduction histidine kinase/ActR/RegA family two-component response regulator